MNAFGTNSPCGSGLSRVQKLRNTNIEKNDTAPFCVPTPTPNPLARVESTKIDLPNPRSYYGATSEVTPILLFLKSERKCTKSRSRYIAATKINAKTKNEFYLKVQKFKKTLP